MADVELRPIILNDGSIVRNAAGNPVLAPSDVSLDHNMHYGQALAPLNGVLRSALMIEKGYDDYGKGRIGAKRPPGLLSDEWNTQ